MTRFSRTRELDADAIARLCRPRDDVVGERLDGQGADGHETRFVLGVANGIAALGFVNQGLCVASVARG